MRLLTVTMLGLVLVLPTTSGCASLMSGGAYQRVLVVTDPLGATVRTAEGREATTPCAIYVRKWSPEVTVEKKGYAPVTYRLRRGFNGLFLGNILLGGILGMGIDLATGAVLRFEDDMIALRLRPQAAAAPPGKTTVAEVIDLGEAAVGPMFLPGWGSSKIGSKALREGS